MHVPPLARALDVLAGGEAAARRAFGRSRLAEIAAAARRYARGVTCPVENARLVFVGGRALSDGHGALRCAARDACARQHAALLAREPAVVLELADEASAALARLARWFGLDAADELTFEVTQNDVLVAFGARAGVPAVAHFALDASACDALERHHRALVALAEEGRADVARPLAFERDEQGARLVQTRLAGAVTRPRALCEAALAHRLELALRPLLALQRAGGRVPGGPDRERVLRDFARLPELYPRFADALRPAVAALASWRERESLRAVRVHGDYWLGNVLFDDAPAQFSGVVDWDRARERGLPLEDALHLGVASVADWRGVPIGDVLPRLWNEGRPDAVLDAHLATLAPLLGFEQRGRDAIAHVGLALWLGYLWNAHVDGLPEDPRWLERMIAPPAAAVATWLRRADRRP